MAPNFSKLVSKYLETSFRAKYALTPRTEIYFFLWENVGPATTQNLVVKFDGEIRGGVLVEYASDHFPSERSSKISCQTSPKFATNFAENFANFTLEIAGA